MMLLLWFAKEEKKKKRKKNAENTETKLSIADHSFLPPPPLSLKASGNRRWDLLMKMKINDNTKGKRKGSRPRGKGN